MTPSRRREMPLALGVAAAAVIAVFVLDRVSSTYLRDPAAPTSVWWPPAAVGFAIMLFVPRRWRALFLGAAVLGNLFAFHHGSMTIATAGFYAITDVLDGAVTAVVLVRLPRTQRSGPLLLHDPVDTVRLVTACVCGTGSAALLVACRGMYGGTSGVLDLTRGYLTAHLVGLAVLTPAMLLAPRTRAGWHELRGSVARNLEWAAHLAVTAALCSWLFFGPAHPSELALVAVPLFIAAARLDPLRAMSVVTAYCFLATAGTVTGHGAIGDIEDPRARQWTLQLVVGVGAVLALYAAITARTRATADARARAAERLLSQAFEATLQPICVTSLDPVRRGTILQVNQSLCDLLWRTHDEMIGCNSNTLVNGPPTSEGTALLRSMLDGEIDRHRIEREMIRSDGKAIPVIQDIAVIRPDEAPAYLVVAVTDLRPDRDAQEILLDALRVEAEAAVTLRRAADTRKALAARTTHDLRTPLMSVQGYLDLLIDDDRLEPDQRAMLDIAVRNTGRVLGLVDDLVTIAGLEGSDSNVLPGERHVSPDSIVDVAIDSITPICARKRQNLVRPDARSETMVQADRVMLERALLNVLSNASKYTPAGGTITVRTVAGGDQVRIVVADTGIGVAADDLPRIGEQFFRAGTARASAIPGTGLGLAITRGVLERHGGSLELASTQGLGTTVTLILPVVARRFASVPIAEFPRRISR